MDSMQHAVPNLDGKPRFSSQPMNEIVEIVRKWTSIEIKSISPIVGGIANHTFRITFIDGSTLILKKYSVDASVRPNRYEIEKSVLGLVNIHIPQTTVKVPKLLYSDDSTCSVGLEDAGKELVTMFDVLKSDTKLDWSVFAANLRIFLKALRELPKNEQQSVHVWQIVDSYYKPLYLKLAREYDLESQLKNYIEIKDSNLNTTVHGDLWPTHFLIDVKTNIFWLVDWEISRISFETGDLEQLQANLWIMKNCNPSIYNIEEISNLMNCLGSDWWKWRGIQSKANFLRWVLVLTSFPHWQSKLSGRELVEKALHEVSLD